MTMVRSAHRVLVTNPADGGFIYWLVKLYVFGALVLCLAGLASLPAAYVAVAKIAPEVPDLAAFERETELATTVYASDGSLLTTLVSKRRQLTPVSQVPPMMINAFLAAEDRSYYLHGGVDFRGIMRAALANLRAGTVRQGGSTITQQVAKAHLSPERTIQRKLKEVVLARRLEARYSKDQILYLYMNHIFLGAGAYGVAAAAKVYFGRTLEQLSVAQMATLAGLVRAPSRYSPRRHPARATRRRDQVLAAMADAGFITAAQLKEATAEALTLANTTPDPFPWQAPHFTEHVRRTLIDRHGKERVYTAGWEVSTTIDPYLQRLAHRRTHVAVNALDRRQGWRGPLFRVRGPAERKELLGRVEKMYRLDALQPDEPYPALITRVSGRRALGLVGKLKVEIPLSLMKWAAPYSRIDSENNHTTDSVSSVLAEGDVVWVNSPPSWMRRRSWGKAGVAGAVRTPMALHQIPRVEGAMYTYDHQSGHVLAMVGGLDYDRSTFNRTVQACRQPGSTYKPIYYSLALDGSRYSMASILQDRPYVPEEGEVWNPQNVHGTLDGRVTMHMSLVRSLNLPSIELLVKVGAKKAEAWARRLGFTTPIHADKALALGASCTRTDELTRSFATFARGGSQRDPLHIRQIRDRQGRVVVDRSAPEDPLLREGDRLDRLWALSSRKERQVIDERTAFLTTKLLRDSVLHGIAARCRIVPVPTGGKGGTSSDTMDVWFVGLTSQWATTAWIGDDNYQRPLGMKEASYTSVIPMWANFMKVAVGKRPHRELPLRRPKGLLSTTVDYITGKPPGPETQKKVIIYYRPGSYHPERENN